MKWDTSVLPGVKGLTHNSKSGHPPGRWRCRGRCRSRSWRTWRRCPPPRCARWWAPAPPSTWTPRWSPGRWRTARCSTEPSSSTTVLQEKKIFSDTQLENQVHPRQFCKEKKRYFHTQRTKFIHDSSARKKYFLMHRELSSSTTVLQEIKDIFRGNLYFSPSRWNNTLPISLKDF